MRTARLSAREVREVFALLAENDLTHQQIADAFDVGRTTITHINQGRAWRNLLPEGWRPAPPIYARGEKNGFAKLSEDEAREIFRLAWSGECWLREIAEKFHISISQVSLVKHRKEWRHLWNGQEEQRMTDKTKAETEMTEDEWQAKLTRLQATLEKLRGARHTPQWQTEMAKAVPDDVVQGVAQDVGLRRVSEPSSMLPQSGGQPQAVRGTGYRDAIPLGPVPGLSIMDGMLDAADQQDRADLEARLARSVRKE